MTSEFSVGLDLSFIIQLDIIVKGNDDVYDFEMLSTFALQDNVRTIVYDKVVCLDSSVLV